MSDLKKLEEAMKKLSDIMPTVHFNGSAFKAGVEAAMKRDETIHKLELVSGMTIEELTDKFAVGWELSPPGYKFNVDLLKRYLETMDKMECNGIDLEEIGSSAPDKIRPIWNLDIDFDKKPEE